MLRVRAARSCDNVSAPSGATKSSVAGVEAMVYVGRTIATAGRALTIAAVASVCVVAYAAGGMRRLTMRDRAARARHRARSRGALLRWAFTRLGATFVKIGQVASARADLFSPQVIAELSVLQDRVPAFGFRHTRAAIERELGGPLERHFSEFQPRPIAAGSIAQVHRARLVTGEEVAVKVLRPGVRARVRRDCALLLWLAHVAYALSPRARAADLIGHTRSLIAGIFAQTDLRHERRNYARFRRLARSSAVAFPGVFVELSTREVLVMELVHGVTIDRVPAAHTPQVTCALREAFFAMCFDYGLVHADLHPGNILVRDDGVVVLLDVGLVKHLSRRVVDQVVDFARCIVSGDARDLVLHLRTHHRYLAKVDWDEVAADATHFVADLRARSIAEIEVSAVVSRLFALARKHHIRPMAELSLVLLGMVTIEGIAKRLDPTANTMSEIARFLAPRLCRDQRRLARGSRELTPAPSGFPAVAYGPHAVPAASAHEPPPPAIARTQARRLRG